MTSLESVWKKDLPDEPFQYRFLNEEIQQQYSSEQSIASIIGNFALIAILISCLGLFGLAAFSAEQRTKEIGIRKVLGAGTANIVRLLSMDFIKLVLIGFILATPIAWWAMQQWLNNYAYKVPLRWWMFGLGGLLALVIAVSTVSFQALKAAMTNPVDSIKSE
jgi:putative ABC transport system permease protein